MTELTGGEVTGYSSSGSETEIMPEFVLPESGESAFLTYEIMAILGECVAERTLRLEVIQPFFIANIVSPNDDEINDVWTYRSMPKIYFHKVYMSRFITGQAQRFMICKQILVGGS